MQLLSIQPLYIGIAAGVCTGVSMLPQLVTIIRDRKADDISITTMLVLFSGLGIWVYYGILEEDIPIISTNAFSALVTLLVIVFSLKYRKQKTK